MTTDYIVSSLPTLAFDAPAPLSWEKFVEACGGKAPAQTKWADLETQLRNAMAEARGGGEKFRRPAEGCSVYWKNRVLACFQEKDVGWARGADGILKNHYPKGLRRALKAEDLFLRRR